MKKVEIMTSAKCPKCNGYLSISPVKGYLFACPSCYEDFYMMEASPDSGEFEIRFPAGKSFVEDNGVAVVAKAIDGFQLPTIKAIDEGTIAVTYDKIPREDIISDVVDRVMDVVNGTDLARTKDLLRRVTDELLDGIQDWYREDLPRILGLTEEEAEELGF